MLSLTAVFAIFIVSMNWSRRMYCTYLQRGSYWHVARSDWSFCLVCFADIIGSVPNIWWIAGCRELEYRLCKMRFVGVFPPFDPRKDTNLSSETLRYFSNIQWQKRSRSLAVQSVLHCGHITFKLNYITTVIKSKWRWNKHDVWKEQWSSGVTWSGHMQKGRYY
jgi:hypothetical protein